jgi:hypothetical protein
MRPFMEAIAMVGQRLEVCQISKTSLEEVELLAPEWVAMLTVYWQSRSAGEARLILDMVKGAWLECTPERSALELLKAMRLLGLLEIQILRLILARFEHHVLAGTDQPARQVAGEVLKTLLSIGKRRFRR